MNQRNIRLHIAFALAILPADLVSAHARAPKLLIVVAHPDDDYDFAATTCCLSRELAGTVDEVVVTNGEGGYRYSLVAEKIYGPQHTRHGRDWAGNVASHCRTAADSSMRLSEYEWSVARCTLVTRLFPVVRNAAANA